ncbi:hypothetical protein [Chryseobacterium sp. IT-36CA2]|uniref:hypothetical protein n=1 Tax=Chryseobacterium sp. IT-36CA2 TaxID=3026460 RepID=UPI0039E08E3D
MENIFKLEQLTHLVLAQYHRWYQVYEVPFTENTILNQKDILSDDVEISSQNGTTKGKEGLEDRLKVFTGWQNAHHVQNSTVTLLEDGNLSLEADILYQNIRPDKSKFSYTLHYSTLLQKKENNLPIFTKLILQPTGIVEDFKFEEAYSENRVKSFMHYWLYLMECPDANKFKELVDDNFLLNLSSGETISDFESFKNWIISNASKLKTSTHQYKNLEISNQNNTEIKVKVDFEWKGITIDNKKMIAETHHQWILLNNTENRFAKMKEMKVFAIKPFLIVDDF